MVHNQAGYGCFEPEPARPWSPLNSTPGAG